MGGTARPTTPAKRSSVSVAAAASQSHRKNASRSSGAASNTLNPSLPRMPSLPGLGAQAGTSSRMSTFSSSISSPSKLRSSPWRSRHATTSSEDPSTANSTEDEYELEDEIDMSIMSSSASTPYAGAQGRARSKSTAAATAASRASTTTPVNNQDSQQNICVCIRVRPSAPGAPEEAAPIWDLDPYSGKISPTDHHPTIEKRKGASSEDVYNYRFDSLLQAPDITEKLYTERIGAVVEAAMEGFNATVFSYGQTGSGKTHTMMGNDDEPGIIPQAVKDIFEYIQNDPSREFLLRISYLEIYNETLKDLLARPASNGAASGKAKELILREEKGRIVVQGLTEEIVKDPQGVVNCLRRGEEFRSVAGTDWNSRSSRSHCVFSMIIESRPKASATAYEPTELPYASSSSTLSAPTPKGEVRMSQLNLIDLAGSERATSQEQRRKEGAFINKSLLSLGTVMQKLADPKTSGGHIPFRDSKLTRLLQTSLSGNARVAVICTISPEAQHGEESLSTLKFASRAMKIVTKAERGVVVDGATGLMIAKYEAQVQDLERRLLEAEALQQEANKNRLGTPRPESRVGEEELDEERQKRFEAEAASEERRLQIIKMEQDIALLQSQIITSHPQISESDPFGAETDDRHYGNIGNGEGPSRPAGPRGKRRISELAFGIGTPLSRLRGQGGSIRSFSSALETVKSPSMASLGPATNGEADSERVQELEKEVDMLKAALQANGSDRREQIDLQARVDQLEASLAIATDKLEQAIAERDEHIQGEGDKAGQIMRLEQQLEMATSESSDSSFKLSEEIAALKAELDATRQQGSIKDGSISELEEKLMQGNSDHTSEVYALSSQLAETKESLQRVTAVAQNKREEIVDLQGQLEKADDAFSKLEARQEQSANAARKQLEKAEKQAQQAENELNALENQRQREQRAALEEISRTREEHQAELREMQEQLEDARSAAASQAERASLEQKQLSMQIADLSADLQRVRQTSLEQSKTITTMKEELERKQATRAAIAAANAPPDFSSLHAKLAAVSGKSASGRSGLGNSLGSSTSSRKSDDGQVENLKTALESLKTEHGRAKETITEQKVEIKLLEDQLTRAEAKVQEKANEITALEGDVRKFRRDIDKMDGLFTAFRDTLCPRCTLNMPLGKPKDSSDPSQTQLLASPPPTAVVERPPPPRSPFGALTGYQQKPHHIKSASIGHGSYLKTSSRPGTPTKNEKYGYTGLHGTPEPLPIPSDWSASAQGKSMRRASLARDLDALTAAGRATSSKSALMSPLREEKRMPSHSAIQGSPSRRSAKGSAESMLWSR